MCPGMKQVVVIMKRRCVIQNKTRTIATILKQQQPASDWLDRMQTERSLVTYDDVGIVNDLTAYESCSDGEK